MDNDDRQSPYSVLTKDDLKEKMNKQIDGISEIFLLPKSESTVLLMYLRWDSILVSYRLSEDKERLLAESGLKSVVIDSNHDSSCGICSMTGNKCYAFDDNHEDDDDVDLISTPFCSHEFCTTCWREYLEKNFYSLEKTQTAISCPASDCQAAVGPDTIDKLTIRDKEMYERYLLRSYLEENTELNIKKCPGSDCNYLIEFPLEEEDEDEEEHSLNVVCLCGYTFCWRCMLESHTPVTCNNASDWLSSDFKNLLDKSHEPNTKTCPCCSNSVEMDRELLGLFLTCACSCRFCWMCLRSVKSHKAVPGKFAACDNLDLYKIGGKVDISCLDRWDAAQFSMVEAKSNLRSFERSSIEKVFSLTAEDMRSIREGLMLIVQCRQVLKWSCVYDHFHTENETSKKEYVRFLQEDASEVLESYSKILKEEAKRAFTKATFEEEQNHVKHNLSIETRNIGDYIYHFIKALKGDLMEVKVKSYDDVGGLCWLCDRCTYGNTWFDKECKMCYDSIVSPLELSE